MISRVRAIASLSRYAAIFLLALLHHFPESLPSKLDVDFAFAEVKGLDGPDLLRLRFGVSSGRHRRLRIHDTAISLVRAARPDRTGSRSRQSFRLPGLAGLRRFRFLARFTLLALGDDLEQRLVRDRRIDVIRLQC